MADMTRVVHRAGEGDSFVMRRIAGETIIVPLTRTIADLDAAYTLNEVGSFIWQLIDGRRSVQAIAEAVSDEYDVTFEQAAQDADELLAALEAKGLARRALEPGRDA